MARKRADRQHRQHSSAQQRFHSPADGDFDSYAAKYAYVRVLPCYGINMYRQ